MVMFYSYVKLPEGMSTLCHAGFMTNTGWWFFAYPSEKDLSSSTGMMKLPIYGKIKVMFQSPPNRTVCHGKIHQPTIHG